MATVIRTVLHVKDTLSQSNSVFQIDTLVMMIVVCVLQQTLQDRLVEFQSLCLREQRLLHGKSLCPSHLRKQGAVIEPASSSEMS